MERVRPTPAAENPHIAEGPRWGDDDARVAVLAVHGRTQSPVFLQGLADRLAVDGLKWRAPAAAGGAWYPYGFMQERPADDPWLTWSLETLDQAMAGLAGEGFPAERVVLLGFSQGACLAAHWALLHPARYAGIVLLTGGYVATPDESVSFAGDFAATPALLAGCERDPWVPRTRMAETEERLRALGCALTTLIEPGDAHEISENALELTRQLLRRAQTGASRDIDEGTSRS